MIRHAESNNNKVYADAKTLFRFGSHDYDSDGFKQYVDTHRMADPHLSPLGIRQADALANEYLNPAMFEHQASSPVRILCSPMLRTLLTIRPTLERLILSTSSSTAGGNSGVATSDNFQQKVHLLIVSFYHEIEGCHVKGKALPGMNPNEIRECLFRHILDNDQLNINQSDIDEIVTVEFVGFDNPRDGWYGGTGHEARVDAEARAAKYCLWLSDYLDSLVYDGSEGRDESSEHKGSSDDLFDVGFLLPGEELEDEHDKFVKRLRRRRTVLAIGHGDLMSVVLKRLVGAYVGCGQGGRLVEQSGKTHRTAFAHYNTGITELEYFGHSRFIVMTTNVTPHIPPERYQELRSGGTLRDGWAFTVPSLPDVTVETELVNDNDSDIDNIGIDKAHDHVQEQTVALKALYMSSSSSSEEIIQTGDNENIENGKSLRFVVKRGFQVLAVATYSERNSLLTDVAIRPTACVTDTLLEAVKQHALSYNKSKRFLAVRPRKVDDKKIFQRMGFLESHLDQNCELDVDAGTNQKKQQSTMTLDL